MTGRRCKEKIQLVNQDTQLTSILNWNSEKMKTNLWPSHRPLTLPEVETVIVIIKVSWALMTRDGFKALSNPWRPGNVSTNGSRYWLHVKVSAGNTEGRLQISLAFHERLHLNVRACHTPVIYQLLPRHIRLMSTRRLPAGTFNLHSKTRTDTKQYLKIFCSRFDKYAVRPKKSGPGGRI